MMAVPFVERRVRGDLYFKEVQRGSEVFIFLIEGTAFQWFQSIQLTNVLWILKDVLPVFYQN